MSKCKENNTQRYDSDGYVIQTTRNLVGEDATAEIKTALAGSCPPTILPVGREGATPSKEDRKNS